MNEADEEKEKQNLIIIHKDERFVHIRLYYITIYEGQLAIREGLGIPTLYTCSCRVCVYRYRARVRRDHICSTHQINNTGGMAAIEADGFQKPVGGVAMDIKCALYNIACFIVVVASAAFSSSLASD